MNEHVIPIFRVTRTELIDGLSRKLESIAEARGVLLAEKEKAVMEAQRNSLDQALAELAEVAARAAFLRDHVGPAECWDVSAQQAVEIWRSMELVKVDPFEVRMSLDPKKVVTRVAHNLTGRVLRT